MVKYIYCLRRREGMSKTEFHQYWRENHARLIQSLANQFGATRYVQAHTLDTPLNAAFAQSHGFTMEPFDGVTQLEWDSMDDFLARNGSPEGLKAGEIYLKDEANFVDFSRSVAFLTEEETVFDFSDGSKQKLARDFYEILNTGDMALLERTLAPAWDERPLSPGQAPGRDGYKPILEMFRAAFPDVRFVPQDVLVSGDKVTVRCEVTGTHQGTFLGVPATGRAVSFRTIDIHRIEGEQIRESWHLEDFFGLMQQLA